MAKTFVAGIGVAIILAGGQFYTSSAYNSRIKEQIQHLQTSSIAQKIMLDYSPGQTGVFSARDQLTVTLPVSQVQQLGLPAEQPLSVIIHNDCTFLPFYITCDDRFSAGNESTRELGDVLTELEYDTGWSANVLFNSVSAWLKTDSLNMDYADGLVDILPMDLSTRMNLSGDELTVKGTWNGVVLTSESGQGASLELKTLNLSADLQRTNDNVLIGDTRFAMDEINIKRGSTGESAYAHDMVYRTRTDKEGDLYNVSQSLSGRKAGITLSTLGMGEQVMKDIQSKVTIDGLTPEIVRYINSPGNSYSDTKQQQAEFEAAFGSQPHTMTISSLNFIYNDVPFTSHGEVFIPTFQPGQMQALAQNPGLKASVTLTIGNTISSLPVYPALQPFLNRWFERSDDEYISHIELKDKALSANGKVISQLP